MHAEADKFLNASDMILSLVSDAAYLVQPDARSRCATLYILTDISTSKPATINLYCPVHVLGRTIHGVPASGSEFETTDTYLCAQEAVPKLSTLAELGHP